MIEAGEFGYMAGIQNDSFINVPLDDVAKGERIVPIDHQLIKSARSIGVSFGD